MCGREIAPCPWKFDLLGCGEVGSIACRRLRPIGVAAFAGVDQGRKDGWSMLHVGVLGSSDMWMDVTAGCLDSGPKCWRSLIYSSKVDVHDSWDPRCTGSDS